jgi:hypothetical protein
MRALWEARDLIAQCPLAISELVSWVSDPTFVGLRTSEAVSVDGRDMPYFSCGTHVQDDLFRRAGRASWLLREATGHPAGIVRVQTDPIYLADLARDWRRWLDDLDGGLACFPGQVARPFRRFVPARRRDLITPVRE